jgi:hypothetical protein
MNLNANAGRQIATIPDWDVGIREQQWRSFDGFLHGGNLPPYHLG